MTEKVQIFVEAMGYIAEKRVVRLTLGGHDDILEVNDIQIENRWSNKPISDETFVQAKLVDGNMVNFVVGSLINVSPVTP